MQNSLINSRFCTSKQKLLLTRPPPLSSCVVFWLTPPTPNSDDVIYEKPLTANAAIIAIMAISAIMAITAILFITATIATTTNPFEQLLS